MGRVFIFCFYFQRFKNIMQTSSILLFWQANNTIVFILSTGRIVHETICLERNCTLKLMRTVFSLVAILNFYFRFRLISPHHQHVWKLKFGSKFEEKKILRKCGVVAIFFLYGNKNVPSAEILRGLHCLRTITFILFGLIFMFLLCVFFFLSHS